MVFGLVVEGLKDKAALEVLVRRCAATESIDVQILVAGGKAHLMKQFPALLNRFRWSGDKGGPVDKAVVIRDSDGRDVVAMGALMEERLAGRVYEFPVKFAFPVREIEAWLLADEEALERATGKKATVHRNAEALANPKERLKSALTDAKVSYTPAVAATIAEHIRLDTLGQRCASFEAFRQAVLDC